MKTTYYKNLNIPNLFNPCYQDIIINKSIEKKLPNSDINIEFIEWLESLNIGVHNCRFFGALPYFKNPLHKDISYDSELSNRFTDCVKLNLIYNSVNSNMIWYELNPDKTSEIVINKVGERLKIYKENDCHVLFETIADGPACLFNGAVIHTMNNGNSTRHCYSMPLINLTTRIRLTWDEANKMLGSYMSSH